MKMIVAILICLLVYPLSAWSTNHKTELQLYTSQVNSDNDSSLSPGTCSGQFFIDGGRDYPNLRDFWLHFCRKSYSIALIGPSETTVTLFANNNYSDQFGFLIIRKIDKTRIWVLDLNKYKPGEWQKVKGMDGYGDFEVYYHFVEGLSFSENISSVKWGNWWEEKDLAPKLTKEPNIQ